MVSKEHHSACVRNQRLRRAAFASVGRSCGGRAKEPCAHRTHRTHAHPHLTICRARKKLPPHKDHNLNAGSMCILQPANHRRRLIRVMMESFYVPSLGRRHFAALHTLIFPTSKPPPGQSPGREATRARLCTAATGNLENPGVGSVKQNFLKIWALSAQGNSNGRERKKNRER